MIVFLFQAAVSFLIYLRFAFTSRNADQIADEIIQFFTVEPGGVVVGHQRTRLIFDALQLVPGKQVKRAVRGLKLHGEVVFVAHNSGQGLAVRRGDRHRALSRIEIPVGIGNRIANVAWRGRAGVAGKIGGDESALTLCHMTLRAAGLAKEDGPAGPGVAGNLGGCALTLQATEMADYGFDLAFTERTEGGHPSSRYS